MVAAVAGAARPSPNTSMAARDTLTVCFHLCCSDSESGQRAATFQRLDCPGLYKELTGVLARSFKSIMNFTTVLWTLLLVALTVLKVVFTIIITTIKTILVKNDWLWTQGTTMVMSLARRLAALLVEGANLGFINMTTTLLHDLSLCCCYVFGLLVSVLSKMMAVTLWVVKYLVSRCRDSSMEHRQANVTEGTLAAATSLEDHAGDHDLELAEGRFP
ncbi:hypothetical protein E2C01_007797 [Portunus trituberculatus]|uniref:Uncharacterized protein n=1 Tax=Portunus trituberculatus TaxID=210409 RepID=A0A5B7D124_PORTR|nr:hypothetical protein [Portunus trituberculatus]